LTLLKVKGWKTEYGDKNDFQMDFVGEVSDFVMDCMQASIFGLTYINKRVDVIKNGHKINVNLSEL
jgi:hypothetical protein